jgi:hypothetical protein
MKALKMAAIVPCLLLVAGSLWAAPQYGEAVIQKGAMTIVREGRSLQFAKLNERIPVNEEDLIRVRPESEVVLTSREKATMTLGSNAVFQVKPWRARNKSGFVRALFGRFRAAIVGLTGGEEFNVKTATATIGVKGTDYLVQATPNATSLGVTKVASTVDLTGQSGTPQDVLENFLSVTLGVDPAIVPTELADELLRILQDLDSVAPNDPGARVLSVGTALVRRGLISQEQLDAAQEEVGEPTTPTTPLLPPLPFDPNEGAGALQRARVPLQFN